MFILQRVQIADRAAKAHLPAMYTLREHMEAGGLASYPAHLFSRRVLELEEDRPAACGAGEREAHGRRPQPRMPHDERHTLLPAPGLRPWAFRGIQFPCDGTTGTADGQSDDAHRESEPNRFR